MEFENEHVDVKCSILRPYKNSWGHLGLINNSVFTRDNPFPVPVYGWPMDDFKAKVIYLTNELRDELKTMINDGSHFIKVGGEKLAFMDGIVALQSSVK